CAGARRGSTDARHAWSADGGELEGKMDQTTSNFGQARPALNQLPSGDVALKISGLTVSYGEKPAIVAVDAMMPTSSMTAIIGPNGAGKSTLLKASLGIVPRRAGQVDVFDKPLARQLHRLAYVPQRASVDWDFPT